MARPERQFQPVRAGWPGTKMTNENVEATKEAGVAELKATKKARAAKQAPPPVVYCLEAPPLPTASALTALTPATLRGAGTIIWTQTARGML
jgi:hypothetical protein